MTLEAFYNHCNARQGFRLAIALLFIISALAYFIWRASVLNQQAMIFSVLFFFAELFGLFSTLLTVFITWRARERHITRPPDNLAVDVFIPTCNESLEIIRITALAAVRIHYPHKTWILDDGNRSEVMQLAKEIGCEYIARNNNKHAKAGNLNNALGYSKAEFIAIFDADHVPEENFLDRLLGYFNDPAVAYVQAPQDFYNTDSFQFCNSKSKKILWHDQTFFYQVGQSGRDYWNATTFCGTSSVLRRSALDMIGGFATETVTEDMHTAVRMQKAGYKSVYHPEPLAYGVAATSYVEFLQQRLRWGHGNVQTLREEKLPFCKGLTIPQKICYTALGYSYFEGWARLILYFTPAIVLLAGTAPIGDTRQFFLFFIPYFLFSYLCIEEYGRGSARFFTSEYMAMARLPVYIMASMGLFIKRKRWRITSKEKADSVPVHLIFLQVLIFVFNSSAFVVGVISPPEKLILIMSGGTVSIVCFWALVNAILAATVIYNVKPVTVNKKEFEFEIPLELRIRHGSNNSFGSIAEKISVNSITFLWEAGIQPVKGEKIILDTTLDNIDMFIPGVIESAVSVSGKPGYRTTCQLIWDDVHERDLFNLKMRHCTWYRSKLWNGKFFHRPSDWIYFRINSNKTGLLEN